MFCLCSSLKSHQRIKLVQRCTCCLMDLFRYEIKDMWLVPSLFFSPLFLTTCVIIIQHWQWVLQIWLQTNEVHAYYVNFHIHFMAVMAGMGILHTCVIAINPFVSQSFLCVTKSSKYEMRKEGNWTRYFQPTHSQNSESAARVLCSAKWFYTLQSSWNKIVHLCTLPKSFTFFLLKLFFFSQSIMTS